MKYGYTALAALILLSILPHASAQPPEFRGLWVHNWRPGLLSPSEVDETVRWAKDCNTNALIIQVRRIGDAYYSSAYEPRACNIAAGPDFDPLQYTIEKAHAEGLQVHAWVNLYKVNSKDGVITDPNHVALKHPEWLSKDFSGASSSEEGRFLDPGAPGVRDYLVKVIADLVEKYDVDGVMLDYVRYPGRNWGYNELALASFNSMYLRTGRPTPTDSLWSDWRRDQVTSTVRDIYRKVHEIKPQIMVSAATIAWGPCPTDFRKSSAYSAVFQDWRSWMREGIFDANMPMNYKDPSNARQNAQFADWVAAAKRWSYGRHVYCGLMLYNSIVGTTRQIQAARRKGAEGVVGLSFSQSDCRLPLAEKLKTSVFAEPAELPLMPWKAVAVKQPETAETLPAEPECGQ